MALTTYPLNDVDYQAEDAELFHCTRNSGIFNGDDFSCSVTGADNNVTIGVGLGWIHNSRFSGKVVALKAALSLTLEIADSLYPRIDAVVIQFDANANQTEIVVKKGTAASSPAAPAVSRTESLYELHLYHIRREAGSVYITPGNITDLRLNESYCGLMADSVTSINTAAINAQISDLINKLRKEISEVEDGSAFLLRSGATPMTGALQMDGNKITGLGAPTDDGDAVNKAFLDAQFEFTSISPTLAPDAVGSVVIYKKSTAGSGYEVNIWLGDVTASAGTYTIGTFAESVPSCAFPVFGAKGSGIAYCYVKENVMYLQILSTAIYSEWWKGRIGL